MTWLLLASLYADEGEYARALNGRQLSHDLPGEPVGPQTESWLLRKVGRLEEAETRAREVLEMDPRSGQAHLTLAAVASTGATTPSPASSWPAPSASCPAA